MPEPVQKRSAKGYWTETLPTGERLFCFKIRRHGRYEEHRYSWAELQQILAEAEPIISAFDISTAPAASSLHG